MKRNGGRREHEDNNCPKKSTASNPPTQATYLNMVVQLGMAGVPSDPDFLLIFRCRPPSPTYLVPSEFAASLVGRRRHLQHHHQSPSSPPPPLLNQTSSRHQHQHQHQHSPSARTTCKQNNTTTTRTDVYHVYTWKYVCTLIMP